MFGKLVRFIAPDIKFFSSLLSKSSENNWEKSAASFCCQVAALGPDMFFNFYLVKNFKITYNPITTEGREKISIDLESFEFKNFFDVSLNLKTIKFYFV